MSSLQQYGLLLGLTVGTVGFVLCLYALARTLGKAKQEPGKDVPATAGQLSRDPVWVRYHARFCFWPLIWKWPTCTLGPWCISR